MVKCGVCLEEYQEGDLAAHREMCVLRLMFRCSLCDEDYMSKEGLLNHLDLHEIVEEHKELHYQEIKAKHKLHQCVLCNDHRAYSESFYRKHVHDVHDGFILRCSDCGEKFRSEELKNDHVVCRCKARDPTVSIKDGNPISIVNEGSRNDYADNSITAKESELPIINLPTNRDLPSRFACDVCGTTFSAKGLLSRHKRANHSCMEGRQQRCLHCRRKFQTNEYEAHFSLCVKKKIECELCSAKFQSSALLARHTQNVHRDKGDLKNSKQNTSKARHHKITKHTKSKFECEKCSKQFHFPRLYSRHLALCDADPTDLSSHKNSGEATLEDQINPKVVADGDASRTKCSFCGIEESSPATLVRHILMLHDPVACDYCGITFSSFVEAQHHQKTKHKESKVKCPHCMMRFIVSARLETHVLQCEQEKVPCDLCGKMFKNATSIPEHQRRSCPALEKSKKQKRRKAAMSLCDETDSSSAMVKRPSPLVDAGSFQPKCHYCGEEFSSPGYLIHHLKSGHDLTKCDICGITLLGISAIKYHKRKCHTEAKYKCPTCGKKFHRKTKFNEHCFTCENKRYFCILCKGTLKQLLSLQRHFKKFHPGKSISNNFKIITVEETTTSSSDDRGAPVQRLPNETYLCNICGITLQNYNKMHRHQLKEHSEAKFQCPHCSKKFHFKEKFGIHASYCAALKYACELCDKRFKLLSKVQRHMKRIHRGCRPLRKADVEGADSTLEENQNSVDKAATSQEMFDAKKTIVSLDHNMDLQLDIKVEEPVLQQQEYQDPNAGQQGSMAKTLDADELDNVIKVKEEYPQAEEDILTEPRSTTESSECHGIPSGRNKPHVSQETNDRVDSCSICGLTFATTRKMSYHVLVCHTDPRYKCAHCEKMFHLANMLRRHERSCSELQCK